VHKNNETSLRLERTDVFTNTCARRPHAIVTFNSWIFYFYSQAVYFLIFLIVLLSYLAISKNRLIESLNKQSKQIYILFYNGTLVLLNKKAFK